MFVAVAFVRTGLWRSRAAKFLDRGAVAVSEQCRESSK